MRVPLAVLVAMTSVALAKPARWQQLPLPPAMPAASDHGVVDVGGVDIYYAVYGNGEPVVLLHGGMGNGDHWAYQLPALVDKFQVIVIDSRGQGRSTRDKTAPTYDLMANDTLAVLDHLKVERASFVGWSDGGEIALKLAIQHPMRVDKLFVIGASYDQKGAKPHGHLATFDAYSAKCRRDYETLSKMPKQWSTLGTWLLPMWRKPMGFTKDQLRAIKAPTIIADGDHDEIIVRAQLDEMVKLIPNARLVILKDTSHFVLWQDPASVNKTLVDFLLAKT